MGIVLSNISKSFGDKKVLENFCAVFEDGKRYCVMGESGCGKTTLLGIISGLVAPDGGTVTKDADKKISLVFQEDRLLESFTVYRNLRLVCGDLSRESAAGELSKIGLGESLDVKVGDLSGGMKRRVAIMRALLRNADIVLMDEPTTGLDEELKYSVLEYIAEKTKGKTVIMVTHDRQEAEHFADEIIEMK